jgi:hypothetical protein
MSEADAGSLAAYINSHSNRFSAGIQEDDGKTWVLIRDSTPQISTRYMEPILYLRVYLDRTDRVPVLLPEFRRLMENWQTNQSQPSDE